MPTTLTQAIAATIEQLRALDAIVASEPAFSNWRPSGYVSPSLLQLFPVNCDTPTEDRQRQAKAIARAIGGKWTRDVHDGSWRTEDGSGEHFSTILHRVDFHQKRETSEIDLSEPQPEPERDEPDYDAPRPLTPMENYQRNDEHHVP